MDIHLTDYLQYIKTLVLANAEQPFNEGFYKVLEATLTGYRPENMAMSHVKYGEICISYINAIEHSVFEEGNDFFEDAILHPEFALPSDEDPTDCYYASLRKMLEMTIFVLEQSVEHKELVKFVDETVYWLAIEAV